MKENLKMLDIIEAIDEQRRFKSFLSVSELMLLTKSDNVILDPLSTLISSEVKIGKGNVFYPSTTIEILNNGIVDIGDNNCFYSQSFLLADFGKIMIGSRNCFGDGGVSIKANRKGVSIVIEDDTRFLNYVQIIGNTSIGSGGQIIGGPITVQDCKINPGASFNDGDPDKRAGVIKGIGLAKNLVVDKGEVINGLGSFDQKMTQRQLFYHPKK